MLDIEPGILDWRRRTDADRWDEMWDGVLHMPPMPNRSHQELELDLGALIPIAILGSPKSFGCWTRTIRWWRPITMDGS
ncbi:MAG: hypothetical protein ABSG53_21430 [Thermoguttaceae bacterium]